MENLKSMSKYKSWFSPGDDIGWIKIENRNSSILADMAFEHGLKKAIEIIAKMNEDKSRKPNWWEYSEAIKKEIEGVY